MGICLIVKSGGGTDTSNATATTDKILSGYTIYVNDNKVTGNMTNNGTQTASNLTAGGSTTIKTGWHNGNGTVTTNSLSNQTQCDIPNQWWCLTGYSYWASGSKYDGAMINRGTKTWSIGANGSQTIEDGWHNGSGTVSQSIPVDTGEWGPTPTTTNQQLCWQGWYYSKNRWCWGNGNLTSGNIKSGVSIFGVSGTWSGWVDSTIQWNAIGASTATCLPGEYTVDGSTITPNQVRTPFNLQFNLATYKKLINHGMVYINWRAVTNVYVSDRWSANPTPYLWCVGTFYRNNNIVTANYNYPTSDHIYSNQSTSGRYTFPDICTTVYSGGYGADMTTSGKYNIRKGYEECVGSNTVDCKILCQVIITAHEADEDYNLKWVRGKCWIKSFNCWFSKS